MLIHRLKSITNQRLMIIKKKKQANKIKKMKLCKFRNNKKSNK